MWISVIDELINQLSALVNFLQFILIKLCADFVIKHSIFELQCNNDKLCKIVSDKFIRAFKFLCGIQHQFKNVFIVCKFIYACRCIF